MKNVVILRRDQHVPASEALPAPESLDDMVIAGTRTAFALTELLWTSALTLAWWPMLAYAPARRAPAVDTVPSPQTAARQAPQRRS